MTKMSSSDVITSIAFVIIFCLAAALAAPVVKQDALQTSKITGSEIENQDRELEDLISLAHKEGMKDNVQVQKVHHSSVERINGEAVQTETTEERVVNAQDGSIVSDVKQEVKEATSGQEGKPEAVVETEVNIPLAGIHKTFLETEDKHDDEDDDENETSEDDEDEVDDDDGADATDEEEGTSNDDDDNDDAGNMEEKEEEDDDNKSGVPLTTEDMAQYLFITQQFEDFLPALERLVGLSKMTATDAAVYAKAVIEEYEKLNMAALRSSIDAEKRSQQQAYLANQQAQFQPLVPDLSRNEQAMFSPAYTPYGFPYQAQQANLYPEQQQFYSPEQHQALLREAIGMYPSAAQFPQFPMNPAQQQQLPANAGQAMDPMDFMAVLYDAAYGRENPEAQAIVQLLYDRVSQDDNPNDLEQIRDLLIDTVSASLYENELPMTQGGPMTNGMPVFDQGAGLSQSEDAALIASPDFMGEQEPNVIQTGNDVVAKRSDVTAEEGEAVAEKEEKDEGDAKSDDTDDDKTEEGEVKEEEKEKRKESEESPSDKSLEDELSNMSAGTKSTDNN